MLVIKENTKKEVPRILIVDDVETNRFTLRDIISDMGYKPILAENGEQALRVIEKFKLQLVISDIAMPQMDGFELCKILKDNPETRDIPIIFISAFDNPEDIVKGFELEGEDYITKPFIPEVVRARVRVHLKLYETNQELLEINRQLQTSVQDQLQQLENERKKVLYALIRIARENANYEEAHMERISYNCRILAEAMQLSAKFGHLISDTFIDTIELAAPLCDLGNISIPGSLLQKNDSLTDAEKEIMHRHTIRGAEILSDIKQDGDFNDFLQMSIDIARCHHENWDGSGYPEGIQGEEIPLSAQIVSIVSEYCALTEKRTYRDDYSRDDSLEIMNQDNITKFNPDIYEIMQKIFRQFH